MNRSGRFGSGTRPNQLPLRTGSSFASHECMLGQECCSTAVSGDVWLEWVCTSRLQPLQGVLKCKDVESAGYAMGPDSRAASCIV